MGQRLQHQQLQHQQLQHQQLQQQLLRNNISPANGSTDFRPISAAPITRCSCVNPVPPSETNRCYLSYPLRAKEAMHAILILIG